MYRYGYPIVHPLPPDTSFYPPVMSNPPVSSYAIPVYGPSDVCPQEVTVYGTCDCHDTDDDDIAPVAVPSNIEHVVCPQEITVHGSCDCHDADYDEISPVVVPSKTDPPVYTGPQRDDKSEPSGEDKVTKEVSETALYAGGPRGFENRVGDNNCFLNVILQSLFLLPPFAKEFAALELSSDNRVYSALKDIFVDYQFEVHDVIPPKEMRKTLSDIFAPESRFLARPAW